MDLQQYVDILHRTESSHDVNSWKYEGIHTWPLFRARIIPLFKSESAFLNQQPKKEEQKIGLREKLLSRYYAKTFRKDFIRSAQSLLKDKACEVLLYSKNHSHTDKVNGDWYDRFTDPYFDVLPKDSSVLKLVLINEKNPAKENYAFQPVLLDHSRMEASDYYSGKIGSRLKFSDSAVCKQMIEATGLQVPLQHLDSAWRQIKYYEAVFDIVLDLLKPKVVFLKCYYENDSAGLVLAARKRGIAVVDIQHGKQGTHHPMYSHWTKIPRGGYELLPNYFWNWGEESKQNIEKWMNDASMHKPVVGGNLWLGKWKRGEISFNGTPDQVRLIDSLKRFRKVILLTLQPIEKDEMVPAFIAEAIKNSPAEWIWLIRRHPFQSLTAQEIFSMVGDSKAVVEVEHSGQIPLYELLRHTNLHITLWSSTAFEANEFRVPTIIAHPFGKKLYVTQIEAGMFVYAQSSDEVMKIISNPDEVVATPYIETELSVAAQALDVIRERST